MPVITCGADPDTVSILGLSASVTESGVRNMMLPEICTAMARRRRLVGILGVLDSRSYRHPIRRD